MVINLNGQNLIYYRLDLNNIYAIISVAFLALVVWSFDMPVYAQVTDPLGNRIFEHGGKEMYKINATYGILEGESSLWRDKGF